MQAHNNANEDMQKKKAWLKSYRQMTLKLKALLEERVQWEAIATHITPQYSDTPKSGGEDRVQRSVDKLADIDEQIFNQLEQLEQRRAEIINAIEQMSDERYKTVLHLHYINGDSFELVAVTMNYDFRWVKELNRRALLALELLET